MLVRRRKSGFTILEILIAIVILVLGISGIIALFPTAIESGNQTVQDSYAAAITQSVIDALAVGIREGRHRVADTDNPPRVWNYFIFDHDGVYDAMVPRPQAYDADPNISMADWCILLPMGKDPNIDPLQEPWFVYPSVPNRPVEVGEAQPSSLPGPYDVHTASALSGLASASVSDNLRDPDFYREGHNGRKAPWIRRVYMLGRYRQGQNPAGYPNRSIREEFLGDPDGPAAGATYASRPVVDPYPQYSFAIMMRRAKIDNCGPAVDTPPDGKIDRYDRYTANLYEVHVLVFRNFDGSQGTQTGIGSGAIKIPRTNLPVKEFVTLLAL